MSNMTAKNFEKKFKGAAGNIIKQLDVQHEALAWALIESESTDDLEHVNTLYTAGITEGYLQAQYHDVFIAYVCAAFEHVTCGAEGFVHKSDDMLTYSQGVALALPFRKFQLPKKAKKAKPAINPTREASRQLSRLRAQFDGEAVSFDTKAVLKQKIVLQKALFEAFEKLDKAVVVSAKPKKAAKSAKSTDNVVEGKFKAA